MLMDGMNEEVSTAPRGPLRIVVKESSSCCESLSQIIYIEMEHVDQERTVRARYRACRDVPHDELPFRKKRTMFTELFVSVGPLGRIHLGTDRRDLDLV